MNGIYKIELSYKSDWKKPDVNPQGQSNYQPIIKPVLVFAKNLKEQLLTNVPKAKLEGYSIIDLSSNIFSGGKMYQDAINTDVRLLKFRLENNKEIIIPAEINPSFLDKTLVRWSSCSCATHGIYQAKFDFTGETNQEPNYFKQS